MPMMCNPRHMAVSMPALAIVCALTWVASCSAEQLLPAHKSRQHMSNKDESKPAVPKIIHQSWKDEHVPERFLKWQESWKRTHPDWEYMCATLDCVLRGKSNGRGFTCRSYALGSPRRFWTDAENRELVAKYYPWFLDTYDFLPHPIMKADSVRLLYMHLYGGDGP